MQRVMHKRRTGIRPGSGVEPTWGAGLHQPPDPLVDPVTGATLQDPLERLKMDVYNGLRGGTTHHQHGGMGRVRRSRAPVAEPPAPDDPFTVDRGQLTFDAEGMEGGRYHSRKAHWPGGVSGVTIGRGYDMGQRGRSSILEHMEQSGISEKDAEAFAKSAGMKGKTAKNFISNNELAEISPDQQKALFDIVYGEMASDVERISGNYARSAGRAKDNPEDFEVDWENLDPRLRDIAVDLRYRGDYTPTTRRKVQPLLIANDVKGMRALMADRKYWKNVPQDRFQRRLLSLGESADAKTKPTTKPGVTMQ